MSDEKHDEGIAADSADVTRRDFVAIGLAAGLAAAAGAEAAELPIDEKTVTIKTPDVPLLPNGTPKAPLMCPQPYFRS